MPDTLQNWLSLLERRHHKSIDLGLDRCARVWSAMNAPRPAARVVTVGGTNGKGSTVAYIAALLSSAGLRVGTYTSPHLLRFNERVRVQGQAADDEALVSAFGRVERARGEVSLTYFEFTTLAAFDLMHSARLDWAVLEVGLGGRLDTVNLVDADAAVITPVGLDHQEYLGPDRESIGFEKAGIFRPGAPVICGDRSPPASMVAVAKKLGAPLYRIGCEFDYETAPGGRFTMRERHYDFPEPPLRGTHQRENLATAIAATVLVQESVFANREAWRSALAGVSVPGRLTSHAADARLIVDVGHNPLAAETVARVLADDPGVPVHCVLGMLGDKDAEGVVAALAPRVQRWYLATLRGSRGQVAEKLEKRLRSVVSSASAEWHPDVPAALAAARRKAGAQERILVFGSFETAAAALRSLPEPKSGAG